MAAGAAVTSVHVQPVPVSSVHVALHPSPEIVLPSSHCSCGNLRPSPQTAVHVPPLHVVSSVHDGEQPSYGIRLPSSHCSKPSFMPSPQTVGWQTDSGGDPVDTHAKPGSSLQVALQPSSEALLPSSHWSVPSTMPLPQYASRVQSWPGVRHV